MPPVNGCPMGARHLVTTAEPSYRYLLWRNWGRASSICVFIGLNPSTADATRDDATSRRCVAYARQWGFDALALVNLFAYRSVEPKILRSVLDPVGTYNDAVIDSVARAGALLVCAWGNHGRLYDRSMTISARLRSAGHRLSCLGITQCGEPVHPLYQRSDRAPITFASATAPPEFSRAAPDRAARRTRPRRHRVLRGR